LLTVLRITNDKGNIVAKVNEPIIPKTQLLLGSSTNSILNRNGGFIIKSTPEKPTSTQTMSDICSLSFISK